MFITFCQLLCPLKIYILKTKITSKNRGCSLWVPTGSSRARSAPEWAELTCPDRPLNARLLAFIVAPLFARSSVLAQDSLAACSTPQANACHNKKNG